MGNLPRNNLLLYYAVREWVRLSTLYKVEPDPRTAERIIAQEWRMTNLVRQIETEINENARRVSPSFNQ